MNIRSRSEQVGGMGATLRPVMPAAILQIVSVGLEAAVLAAAVKS